MNGDSDYMFVLASFVGKRDGMALELHDSGHTVLAEVFEDDETRACTFSTGEGVTIPLPVLAEFLQKAADEFPQVRWW